MNIYEELSNAISDSKYAIARSTSMELELLKIGSIDAGRKFIDKISYLTCYLITMELIANANNYNIDIADIGITINNLTKLIDNSNELVFNLIGLTNGQH